MKRKTIKVPIYNYDFHLLEVESVEDAKRVQNTLIAHKIPKEHTLEVVDNIKDECVGGAIIFTNVGRKCCVVVIYKPQDVNQRAGTLAHELNHFVTSVMQATNIQDEEAHCYLLGYLMSTLI